MPPFPSAKQFLGVGREVTKGTAVVASDYIPIRSIAPKRVPTPLADESLRGSAVDSFAQAQGIMHTEFAVEGDVFLDSFGWWLKGILGEEALVGTAPTAHNFTVLNSGDMQPPGTTLVDNYGIACRSYPGGQVSELGLSWDIDGLLTYSATAQALLDATITAPTPSYGTLAPQPAWSATATFLGSPARIESGEWTLSRNITPIHVQDGAQTPRHIWVGALSLSATMMLLMEDDGFYTSFLNNTQGVLSVNFIQGANGLTLLTSKTAIDDATIDRGEDYIRLSLDVKALGNTTDAGASGGMSSTKVSLSNSRATAY